MLEKWIEKVQITVGKEARHIALSFANKLKCLSTNATAIKPHHKTKFVYIPNKILHSDIEVIFGKLINTLFKLRPKHE